MKGTKTSSFGTKGRVAHDSSKFYNSKLYKEIKNNNSDIIVNEFPNELLNTIIAIILKIHGKRGLHKRYC